MNLEQHEKLLAFAKRSKAPGAAVDLIFGADYLRHATVTSQDGVLELRGIRRRGVASHRGPVCDSR